MAHSIPAEQLAPDESAVRRQMAAATGRIRRLKTIDRLAVGVITLGGVAVIVSVIAILVFIAAAAVPLFRASSAQLERSVHLVGAPALSTPGLAAFGADETRRYVYIVEPAGQLAFFTSTTGARVFDKPVPSLTGATVTASSRSLEDDYVALGTGDGRVGLVQVQFTPVYEGGVLRDITVQTNDRGLVVIDPSGRPVRSVAYLERDDRKFVAALLSDTDLALWWTDSAGTAQQTLVQPKGGDTFTTIAVGRTGTAIAGTQQGAVYHWDLGDTAVQTDVVSVGTLAHHGAWLRGREPHARRGHRRRRGQRVVPRTRGVRRTARAGSRGGLRVPGRRRHRVWRLDARPVVCDRRRRRLGDAPPPDLRAHSGDPAVVRRGPPRGTGAAQRRLHRRPPDRRPRPVLPRQSASRGQLGNLVRQGLVRGLSSARVRLAVHRRHR